MRVMKINKEQKTSSKMTKNSNLILDIVSTIALE